MAFAESRAVLDFLDDDYDEEIPDLIADWDSDDSECSSTSSQTSTIIIINEAAPLPLDTVSTSCNPFDLSGNHERGDEYDSFSVPDYSLDGDNVTLLIFASSAAQDYFFSRRAFLSEFDMRSPAQYVIIFYSTLSSLRYSNFQYLTSDSTVTGIHVTALIADLFETDVSNRLSIITFQGFGDLTDLPIANLCQICAQLTEPCFYVTLNFSNCFGYLKIYKVTSPNFPITYVPPQWHLSAIL